MKEGVDVWRKRVISIGGDYSQGDEGRVFYNAGGGSHMACVGTAGILIM